MQKRIFATTQRLMRFLCAVALISVGFAHHPAVSSAAELPQELLRYRLPDGSLPIICTAEKTSDGKQHDKAHMQGCEACRISTATLLPAPPDDPSGHHAFVRQDMTVPGSDTFRRQLYPPNGGPRAPPALQNFA